LAPPSFSCIVPATFVVDDLHPRDNTLRRLDSAQVQSHQYDPTHERGATHKKRNYVAKNAFRDKIPGDESLALASVSASSNSS
jgi:hypothetical protein